MKAACNSRKISFEICQEAEEPARLIMEWRNDADSRRQSFHGELKKWPEFFAEYKRDYLADPTMPPLFALVDGKRVGFLRFRRIAHPGSCELAACDISINVAPEHRGRGLGRRIMRAVLPVVQSWGIDSILAEVKIENTTSVAMFEAAGFRLLDEIDHEVTDLSVKVPVKRLLVDLKDISASDGQRCSVTMTSMPFADQVRNNR